MKFNAVQLKTGAYSILLNFTELAPLPREPLLGQGQFLKSTDTTLSKSQLQMGAKLGDTTSVCP